MATYTKPQQWKKDDSEMLRGEGNQIESPHLSDVYSKGNKGNCDGYQGNSIYRSILGTIRHNCIDWLSQGILIICAFGKHLSGKRLKTSWIYWSKEY